MTLISEGIRHEIRQELRDAGISQRRAANLTGIPLTTLSRRLRGDGRPFLVTELVAMAEMLDTPVSAIFADAEAATLVV